MNEFDFVATGRVERGEYMRRYLAEVDDIPYRELTDNERESVDEQEAGR